MADHPKSNHQGSSATWCSGVSTASSVIRRGRSAIMSSHDLGDGSTQTLDWNDLWPCVRELYMVRRSREILCPAWLYGHERDIFYYAFSCLGHGPYVRCSIANLANCRFTLVLLHSSKLLINVDQRQSSSSITVSSTG